MDSKRYSIDEIASVTALSAGHLTRPNGPLDRIAQTYYWIDDIVGASRRDCSEFGLECLQDYLLQVGKKGDSGQSYPDWQQEIWQRYQRTDALEASAGLVPVPRVEIVDNSQSLDSLDATMGDVDRTLTGLKTFISGMGKNHGRQLVSAYSQGLNDEVREGISEIYSKLSTLGKGN